MPLNEEDDFNIEFSSLYIKELQDDYPYVQWLDYIKAILPKDVKVDKNEIIILNEPEFFDQLGKLLEETPKRLT